MSKFLNNTTARIFFRVLGFIVLGASAWLWWNDNLSNMQLTYVLLMVVLIFIPREFAKNIITILLEKFKR